MLLFTGTETGFSFPIYQILHYLSRCKTKMKCKQNKGENHKISNVILPSKSTLYSQIISFIHSGNLIYYPKLV